MAAPRWDYVALRPISYLGRTAYNPGDGLMAQVVGDLGLVVGEDVAPARPDVVDGRPDADAPRAVWVTYAVGRGMDPAQVDELGLTELRERFPTDEPALEAAIETTPGEAGDLGDDVPAGPVDEVLAWVHGGDDPVHGGRDPYTRAVLALAAERARDRPRRGVTEPLAQMLGDEPAREE